MQLAPEASEPEHAAMFRIFTGLAGFNLTLQKWYKTAERAPLAATEQLRVETAIKIFNHFEFVYLLGERNILLTPKLNVKKLLFYC